MCLQSRWQKGGGKQIPYKYILHSIAAEAGTLAKGLCVAISTRQWVIWPNLSCSDMDGGGTTKGYWQQTQSL